MPIEFKCESCGKRLKATDQHAGRSLRCPACGAAVQIPTAEEGATTPDDQAKGKEVATDLPGKTWSMKTSAGEVYGPVSRAELDAWVRDGRVDGQCQLQPEGDDGWMSAASVYSQLANAPAEAASNNPFAGIGPQQSGEEGAFAGVDTRRAAVNPYAAPQEAGGHAGESYVTDGVRFALQKTRPWVLFLSILGFIVAGLIILVSLGLIGVGIAGGARSAGFGIGAGLFYMLFAALYGLPAYFLFLYGSRIGDFLRGGDASRLETAIRAQAAFWKTLGIIVLTMIVLYVAFLALMIAIGFVGAFAVS